MKICMNLEDSPTQFGFQQHRQQLEFAAELLLYCLDCGCEDADMSAVPQGAFAACKVRANEEKFKRGCPGFQQRAEKLTFNSVNATLSPLQYNTKLMNSVWGMYNRYSVHNLKKNIDDNLKFAPNQQSQAVGSKAQKYSC